MLRSMTGYGKQTFSAEGLSIAIEIRALNSKQFDLNVRIASLFREKENEIRTLINDRLHRGKIDLNISVEKRDHASISINSELAKEYTSLFVQIAKECNLPATAELIVQALKMPDVSNAPNDELTPNFWNTLFQNVEIACDAVDDFRKSEGLALEKDIIERVEMINQKIDIITPFEQNRMAALRTKFENHLSEINIDYNKNRLEEELVFYIEKLDITEEKVRLRKHCEYFMETLRTDGNALGKKLGFILQEVGREINTIGSKANDFQIQQIVVNMKDELEKIKEQLANIL
ncbi:YicC family protein [Bacteroidales bacterium OttesenSCG-928-B11]|nr:YicC family protein [Bacteroidales bacterium OttesenSCG-928-E04]MDL2309109.1 YicC family protein [Bacteroidales bacterium OttesenSCG-928-C03]MDL2312942.1 YicC family protein [Bacteroidales bacterium OttesenSCG-928-B11]MDL2326672.1 YicC family protein [Bacteroidales bacterium OttesenSCG-928-A14]